MSKYNLGQYLLGNLGEHLTTLKAASFDSSKQEYLCNDTAAEPVYNFDNYVKCNYDLSHLPASPDAVFLNGKNLYFIEFKNQVPAAIDREGMRRKFEKGTEILKNLLVDFKARDIKYIFCIVHQSERVRYFDARHIESMAARFGLEKKNIELGGFYSNIIAENIDFYRNTFIELQC